VGKDYYQKRSRIIYYWWGTNDSAHHWEVDCLAFLSKSRFLQAAA
jgi:hypothetical protein